MSYPYAQPTQSAVHPSHAQALQVLPMQWPQFFQGFDLQSYQGITIHNPEYPNVLCRVVMRHIIEKATTSRLCWQMYVTTSANNFMNGAFLDIVRKANSALNMCLARQMPLDTAFTKAGHAAIWRWLSDYADQNAMVMNFTQAEQGVIANIKQAVSQFEASLAQQPQQSIQGMYGVQPNPGYMQQHQQPMNSAQPGQSIYDIANSMTGGYAAPTYNPQPDYNGGNLASPLYNAPDVAPPAPVAEPIPVAPAPASPPLPEEKTVMPTTQTADNIIVPNMLSDVKISDVLDVRKSTYVVANGSLIETNYAEQGAQVDYERHKQARLFNDGRPWGLSHLDSLKVGDSAIDVLSRASSVPSNVVGEGDVPPAEDFVITIQHDNGQTLSIHDSIHLDTVSHDAVMSALAEAMSTSDAAVAAFHPSVAFPETDVAHDAIVDRLYKYHAKRDLTGLCGYIAQLRNDDPLVAHLALRIDEHLTQVVFGAMNYELHLYGDMGYFSSAMPGVHSYLTSVNELSLDWVMTRVWQHVESIAGMLSSTLFDGVRPLQRLSVMTRARASSFGFLIAGKAGKVSPTLTPKLHAACHALWETARQETLRRDAFVLAGVTIYTLDGVRVDIHNSPVEGVYTLVRHR